MVRGGYIRKLAKHALSRMQGGEGLTELLTKGGKLERGQSDKHRA